LNSENLLILNPLWGILWFENCSIRVWRQSQSVRLALKLEIRGMLTSDKVMTPPAEASIGQAPLQCHPAARVLIVDDEPAACKLLALFLSQADFDCKTALSGAEALRLLENDNHDAIVCDLNMPGMSGMELLAEVRRRSPHMAFLVATGLDDLRAGIQAMKSGADDYLVKPLQEELVIASLHRALQKKRLEQEVEGYRLHLEEMVVERTKQIQDALKLVERSYEDTLEALGAAIDLRDAATEGHSRRVCRFALEIAKAMGLSEGQHKTIAMGAYLHDIGKLALPDGILLKPGPLTAEERELMQQHVQTGYDLVKQIPFLSEAAELILTHHERWDGNGYLRGLKADQTPIGARIFAISDSLDAITSDRPYRSALPFEEGFKVIRNESGRLYDPTVVEAFFTIPKETWPTIARNQRLVRSLPSWLRSGGALGPLASPLSSPRT
jgi:putative nucleotidyltransferase with HDIG domain